MLPLAYQEWHFILVAAGSGLAFAGIVISCLIVVGGSGSPKH
jgi:hypothetical protein